MHIFIDCFPLQTAVTAMREVRLQGGVSPPSQAAAATPLLRTQRRSARKAAPEQQPSVLLPLVGSPARPPDLGASHTRTSD